MFNIFTDKIKLPKSFWWFERKLKNDKLKEVIVKLYKEGYENGYKEGYKDGKNGYTKDKNKIN